jgi:hypothetical protein
MNFVCLESEWSPGIADYAGVVLHRQIESESHIAVRPALWASADDDDDIEPLEDEDDLDDEDDLEDEDLDDEDLDDEDDEEDLDDEDEDVEDDELDEEAE